MVEIYRFASYIWEDWFEQVLPQRGFLWGSFYLEDGRHVVGYSTYREVRLFDTDSREEIDLSTAEAQYIRQIMEEHHSHVC